MALGLLMPWVAACSPQVALTIQSEPSGAMVFEGDTRLGQAPVTLNYPSDGAMEQGGCMATRPISVQWDNGAQARVNTISVCANAAGGQAYTFVYPNGFPAEGERPRPTDPDAPIRRVTADGQLYYDVSHAPTESVLRCFSNLDGNQVVTHCGG